MTHPYHDHPGPDAKHDPRPGQPAPLVLDEPSCHAYRKLAGLRMQHAIYQIECPVEAADEFASAWAMRAEFCA